MSRKYSRNFKQAFKKVLDNIVKIYRNVIHQTKPPINCINTKDYFLQEKESLYHYKQIDPEHRITRTPPKSCSSEIHNSFIEEYVRISPETFITTLPYGRIYGYGVVLTRDNLVLRDVSLTFESSSKTHWICESGNLPTPTYIDKSVAVLSSAGADSYFHWVFDVLPRLRLIDSTPVDLIYINNHKKFQREYLKLFGIAEPQILSAKPNSHIQAKNLIVPSLPGITGNITKQSYSFLRSLLKGFDTDNYKSRRIYLSREDAAHRKVINEDEIVSTLQEFGFEVVKLGNLSVREQLQLFFDSAVIVGPHGAGFSNLVFCQQKAKIIEFFDSDYVNVCYWALSEQCQLEYYYLISNKRTIPIESKSHPSDIYVNVNELKKVLEQIF